MKKNLLFFLLLVVTCLDTVVGQQSVARQWNEAMLTTIRKDFARPPVQARNLFHASIAMYDAWAAYDDEARPYLLGDTVGTYICAFEGIPAPTDVEAARNEAISFAMYRFLLHRYATMPGGGDTIAMQVHAMYKDLMVSLGYDPNNADTDYQSGSAAALGNYIAQSVIEMGYADGSNEAVNYVSQYYQTVNPALYMSTPGNATMFDPNRWQRLALNLAIDQNGNPIPSIQNFQSPEWGNVQPFAMKSSDVSTFQRNGHDYKVYHDPGDFPHYNPVDGGEESDEFKWNMELVTAWGSHHTTTDGVMWEISPNSVGNVASFPTDFQGYQDFYDFANGGDPGIGHELNPKTGLPYVEQVVPRGDYTRVLAQFWADGPSSETPPGHWFVILNKVAEHPDFVPRFNGKGDVLDELEWDVKAYFSLGGAVHDAAITAWGIKGWYDGVRPVSALRYMAAQGQSSDPGLPSYNPAGIGLHEGLIEVVLAGDPLAGASNQNVGKIKFYTWRGPNEIVDPINQVVGVDWILADNWWTFQRKTFVTPPFAGYISGHATYSRSAAEVLTYITGDAYFPGGMSEYYIPANSNFLGVEKGPSVDIRLQWATYRDASDQCSLSRIWGGIHPPMDDIPGRIVGIQIANDADELATSYFYRDQDADGYYTFEDCDDNNQGVYLGAQEFCDNLDNDCNGDIDDMPFFTYYVDADQDGFGDIDNIDSYTSCLVEPFAGYAANTDDCDDNNSAISPNGTEFCNDLDDDCNGQQDEGLTYYTYYEDADSDGYGISDNILILCYSVTPTGFATIEGDCNDATNIVNPGLAESCDNIDNDCNDLVDDMPFFNYYYDNDADNYGSFLSAINTCETEPPTGYAAVNTDCNDADSAINPGVTETCDDIDNNCNTLVDDELPLFTFFADTDLDGYGDSTSTLVSCHLAIPNGYVATPVGDCNDDDADINPSVIDIIGDGIDNNCNGVIDIVSESLRLLGATASPNPVQNYLVIKHPQAQQLQVRMVSLAGQTVSEATLDMSEHSAVLDVRLIPSGMYLLYIRDLQNGQTANIKVVKME